LIFDANGGTLKHYDTGESYNTSTYTKTVYPNEKFDLLVTATKPGYEFKGWATEENPTVVKFIPTKTNTTASGGYLYGQIAINENTKVVAVWEQIHCTITYNANGGTGEPAEVTVAKGTWYVMPAEEPTFSDKKFVGWATTKEKADRGIVDYMVNGSPITITSDLDLFAVWDVYVITYSFYTYEDNDGAWGYGDFGKVEEIFYADTIAQITNESPLERAGYTFLGWTTDRTKTLSHKLETAESYVKYKAGDAITIQKPLKLYGVWYLDTSEWSDSDYIDDFLCAPAVSENIEKVLRPAITAMPSNYYNVYMKALKRFRAESNDCVLLRRLHDGGSTGYLAVNFIEVGANTASGPLFHEWGHLVDRYYYVDITYDWLQDTVAERIRGIAETEIDTLISTNNSVFVLEAEYAEKTTSEYREMCIENVVKDSIRYNDPVTLTDFQAMLHDTVCTKLSWETKGHATQIYGVVTTFKAYEKSHYLTDNQETSQANATAEAIAEIFSACASGDDTKRAQMEAAFPGINAKAEAFMSNNA
jgi:uncharacterized repeat protein (TIGR02543 family)